MFWREKLRWGKRRGFQLNFYVMWQKSPIDISWILFVEYLCAIINHDDGTFSHNHIEHGWKFNWNGFYLAFWENTEAAWSLRHGKDHRYFVRRRGSRVIQNRKIAKLQWPHQPQHNTNWLLDEWFDLLARGRYYSLCAKMSPSLRHLQDTYALLARRCEQNANNEFAVFIRKSWRKQIWLRRWILLRRNSSFKHLVDKYKSL